MQKWLVVFLLLISLQVMGQEKEILEEDYANYSVEMADQMRDEGKIYVLVGIIGIIMAGLLIYVVSTDKRISRLEKELRD